MQHEINVEWLHRNGAAPGTTDLLEKAIRGHSFPPGDGFAWAAGEAATIRAIRDYLLKERGANKEWTRTTGYWKRGTADHDHDQQPPGKAGELPTSPRARRLGARSGPDKAVSAAR